jgi:hypothetical protein
MSSGCCRFSSLELKESSYSYDQSSAVSVRYIPGPLAGDFMLLPISWDYAGRGDFMLLPISWDYAGRASMAEYVVGSQGCATSQLSACMYICMCVCNKKIYLYSRRKRIVKIRFLSRKSRIRLSAPYHR